MSDAATTQPCNCDNDVCEKLRKEIDDLINRNKRALGNEGTHGLAHRFPEQIHGLQPPGSKGWLDHENEIRGGQRKLQNKLDEYEKNKCGDPPPGARTWATRPLPTAEDYKGSSTLGSNVGKAAALTGGAYVAYRAIRLLPSVLAPPTLIPNLAIP